MSRAVVVSCLALGAVGGLNAIAASCSSNSSVSASQLTGTINRSEAVSGFAGACVRTLLTATSAGAMTPCTSARISPSALPATVIATSTWSATPEPSGFANVDYWSVVIGAFVKPLASAPELRFYQVPVAVVNGLPRATAAPALINGPDIGYDVELDYPAQVSVDTDAYKTVAAFLCAWLTGTFTEPGSGDISRYSISQQIRRFDNAPFASIAVQSMSAQTNMPGTPQNGFTTAILVTAKGTGNDSTEQALTFPLTIVRQSDKWFVADIDLVPRLAGRITKPTPANSAADSATRQPR